MEKQSISISVNCSETAPCCLSVAVTVPAESSKQAYKAAIRKVGSEAKMPGFRPGKIPVPILLKAYGQQINAQTTEILLESAVAQAAKDNDLDFYTRPDFSGEKAPELYVPDQDYSITFTVEVFPKITLPQYKGISVSKNEVVVTQEETNEYILSILEQRATFESVQRPARQGDMLQANYTADVPEEMLNNEQIKYLLKGENSWLMLREPELLPGMSTALLNLSVGEHKDIELTFPADFRHEALQNKTYMFHFDIQDIKSKVVPALDESFLKELKFESEEKLCEAVKEMLVGRKQQSEDGKVRAQLQQVLLSGQDFPVPPSLLQFHKHKHQQELARMMSYQGMKDEDIKAKLAESEKEIENKAISTARLEIILRQIGQAENVSVTNQMLANVIANSAEQNAIPFNKAVQKLRENGQLPEISRAIFHELAFKAVVDASQMEVIKEEN